MHFSPWGMVSISIKHRSCFGKELRPEFLAKEDTCFVGPFRGKDAPIFGKNGNGAENGCFMQVSGN
jgi:hypothetical protein